MTKILKKHFKLIIATLLILIILAILLPHSLKDSSILSFPIQDQPQVKISKENVSGWGPFYTRAGDKIKNDPETICNNLCEIIDKGGVFDWQIPRKFKDTKSSFLWRYTIYKYDFFSIHEYSIVYSPGPSDGPAIQSIRFLNNNPDINVENIGENEKYYQPQTPYIPLFWQKVPENPDILVSSRHENLILSMGIMIYNKKQKSFKNINLSTKIFKNTDNLKPEWKAIIDAYEALLSDRYIGFSIENKQFWTEIHPSGAKYYLDFNDSSKYKITVLFTEIHVQKNLIKSYYLNKVILNSVNQGSDWEIEDISRQEFLSSKDLPKVEEIVENYDKTVYSISKINAKLWDNPNKIEI